MCKFQSEHKNDHSWHLYLYYPFLIKNFCFHFSPIIKHWTHKAWAYRNPSTIYCINLHICITMILHSKYCSLSIAGFLKRILLKIYFISPFYLYKLESPLPKDNWRMPSDGKSSCCPWPGKLIKSSQPVLLIQYELMIIKNVHIKFTSNNDKEKYAKNEFWIFLMHWFSNILDTLSD
jgi:hypothetical protein